MSLNKLDHMAVCNILIVIEDIMNKNPNFICGKCDRSSMLFVKCDDKCKERLYEKVEHYYKSNKKSMNEEIEKLNKRIFRHPVETTFTILTTSHIYQKHTDEISYKIPVNMVEEVKNEDGAVQFQNLTNDDVFFNSSIPNKHHAVLGKHCMFVPETNKLYLCEMIYLDNGIIKTPQDEYKYKQNELNIDLVNRYPEITRENIIPFVMDIYREIERFE